MNNNQINAIPSVEEIENVINKFRNFLFLNRIN